MAAREGGHATGGFVVLRTVEASCGNSWSKDVGVAGSKVMYGKSPAPPPITQDAVATQKPQGPRVPAHE
jgi:hypothetical protein